MHIVLDVLVAAIVVFTVIGAVRKGFVRSLLSLVGLVLSLVLTYSFAVPFGAVIDSEVVTPMAAKSILKQSELDGVTLESPLAEFPADTARYNKKRLNLYDGSTSTLLAEYESVSADADATVGDYLGVALNAHSYTGMASAALAAVVIFIGVAIVVWVLKAVLTPIMRLPVLHQFDKLLGLVVGVVNAAVVLFLFVAIVSAVGYLVQVGGGGDYGALVDKTHLFKYIYDSPLHTILK